MIRAFPCFLLLCSVAFAQSGPDIGVVGPHSGRLVSDIRSFGARCDGVTDDSTAIQNALNAGGNVTVPSASCAINSGITIPANTVLSGVNFEPANPPGGSQIICASAVVTCITVSNNLNSAGISDLTIAGAAGTPNSGSIGILWNGGYNSWARNVNVSNFDICSKWLASGTNGISFEGYNYNQSKCQSHFFVFDGWPEAHFVGGRTGANGSGDFTATSEFVFFTKTQTLGAGGGPNSITFEDHHFIDGGGVQCAIRWGGFTGSGGLATEYRFSNDHLEWHNFTGGGTQGIFCSDSTVTLIPQFLLHHTVFVVPSIAAFSLNAATALQQWWVNDNQIGGCSGITLAPSPASGAAFSDIHFSRNFGCSSASFTSNGTGTNRLFLSENTWGTSLTVAGNWDGQLSSTNDQYASLTDTASGNVSWANPTTQSWTPVLTFGGGSTGITYSTQAGYFSRTSDGGYTASFFILLTSKGSSTGSALITGLPKQCSNGSQSDAAAGIMANYASTSGLTGAPTIYINPSSTNIVISQTSATGSVQLADTSFTNTTQISGTIKCAHTN